MKRFMAILAFAACNTAQPVISTSPVADGGSTTYSIVNVTGPDGATVGQAIQQN